MSVVTMDFLVVISTFTLFLTLSIAESIEEEPYSHPYAPSTVSFHDIYNKLTVLDDRTSLSSDETSHINQVPTQFVEFHPKVLKISRITPPPRVILNASYIKTTVTEESTTNGYTNELEEPMKVIPIRDQQRGVLDVLFPASRVRSFKDVFDSVRRLLSYTF